MRGYSSRSRWCLCHGLGHSQPFLGCFSKGMPGIQLVFLDSLIVSSNRSFEFSSIAIQIESSLFYFYKTVTILIGLQFV